MKDFHISNSLMNDWATLCPRVFKARHIDKLPEAQFKTTQDMRWGQIFETMAIGAGVGGQVTIADEKEQRSEFYSRVKIQAAKVKGYFRQMKGNVIKRQYYVYATVTDSQGQEIPIMGGWDVYYRKENGRLLIIDIKLTGDTENDFGKFAWGSPEKMDLKQAKHYIILHEALFNETPDFEYWVFDKGSNMKEEFLNIEITEESRFFHIEECSRVYNEIMLCIQMKDFPPVNTYKNCKDCPVPCEFRRVIPELKTITI